LDDQILNSVLKELLAKDKAVSRDDIIKALCKAYELDFKAIKAFSDATDTLTKAIILNGKEIYNNGFYTIYISDYKTKHYKALDGSIKIAPAHSKPSIRLSDGLTRLYKLKEYYRYACISNGGIGLVLVSADENKDFINKIKSTKFGGKIIRERED